MFIEDCDNENTSVISLRGHVLDDAVEKVKTLVVVGFGGNKLLENSKQARLRREKRGRLFFKKIISRLTDNENNSDLQP